MTTQEKIAEILNKRYNNYKGRLFKPLKPLHNVIRRLKGDKEFLKFLEKSEEINPRPVYQIPDEIKKIIEELNVLP